MVWNLTHLKGIVLGKAKNRKKNSRRERFPRKLHFQARDQEIKHFKAQDSKLVLWRWKTFPRAKEAVAGQHRKGIRIRTLKNGEQKTHNSKFK